MRINAAIAGGTGYTAGELLRLLLNHPHVAVTAVLSGSAAGQPVAETHRDLLGDTELRFTTALDPAQVAALDVLFLCLGHGVSREYLAKQDLPEQCRIIDLGNDFRLDPHWQGRRFVYGLTETNREMVHTATAVANPGCFATSILLPLVPLSEAGLLCDEIHVHSLTGSTGAGKTLGDTTHFSYRESNVSIYKPFAHQHLGEIRMLLGESCEVPQINMVPMRGGFTRGIFTSLYSRVGGTAGSIRRLLTEYYASSPFVHLSEMPLSLKEVVNTNKALIHIGEHDGYMHFTCILDNLLKGASGQAVQNMNVMFGLDEASGLKLKPTAF